MGATGMCREAGLLGVWKASGDGRRGRDAEEVEWLREMEVVGGKAGLVDSAALTLDVGMRH